MVRIPYGLLFVACVIFSRESLAETLFWDTFTVSDQAGVVGDNPWVQVLASGTEAIETKSFSIGPTLPSAADSLSSSVGQFSHDPGVGPLTVEFDLYLDELAAVPGDELIVSVTNAANDDGFFLQFDLDKNTVYPYYTYSRMGVMLNGVESGWAGGGTGSSNPVHEGRKYHVMVTFEEEAGWTQISSDVSQVNPPSPGFIWGGNGGFNFTLSSIGTVLTDVNVFANTDEARIRIDNLLVRSGDATLSASSMVTRTILMVGLILVGIMAILRLCNSH